MSIEDIKEAIEVLEDASAEMLMETGDKDYYREAIAILRQAIKQAEQAHAIDTSQERVDETAERKHMTDLASVGEVGVWGEREWVGLTDEEIEDLIYLYQKIDASNSPYFYRRGFARAIEVKLRDKNI